MMRLTILAVVAGAALAGQCTSNDHKFWSSYGSTFSNFLTGCAKKEWGNAEKTARCLVNDPESTLSGACGACFGDFEQCAKDQCWFHCMWDPTSNWCLSCIESSKCPGELETCTGFPSDQLPPRPVGSLGRLPALGECSANDYDFWSSYGQTFSNFLTGCAKKEWGNAKKTSQCLLDDPMNKLSGSCTTCFGDFQGCAKDECWFKCMWDATSNWCLKCIDGSKCPGELSTCTGYTVADLPPNPSTSIKSLPTTTMPPTTSTTTTTTTMTTTSPSMSTYPPTTTESSSISSTSPIVATTVIPYGKCTSADHMLWTSYGQAYSNYIAYCGQQAWGSADGTSKCLEKSGLTSSCSTCFGDSVQCGRDKCMFSCISGPATSKCLSCIAKTECNPALYKCTGYQPVDMPPAPTGTDALPSTTSAYPSSTISPTTVTVTTLPVVSTTTSTSTPATTTSTSTPATTTSTSTPATTTITSTPVTTTSTSTPATTTTTSTPATTTTTSTPATTTATSTTTIATSTTTTMSSTFSTTVTSTSTTSSIVTPSAQGECSVVDHNLWASYDQAYSNYIAYCGKQAWGSADGTTKCLEKSGLTSSCSTCFGQSVECGRDKCMFKCLSGPATSKCLNCIAKTECNPDLYKCTGYQASDMPPAPTGVAPLPVSEGVADRESAVSQPLFI
ncbi:hypothetical protein FOL47_009416 [Perkinsus chesapeaki]|uniref:Immunoglobulin super DCC subclass member n=1 Tax=Perkinsus chesapeaki TaxID=330153 RepID=A0A7J6L8H2_PERCH|nr:hypothetical protein FOL47_009416 [Perkinsus chesapeaki]